jgi:hypothetical protein
MLYAVILCYRVISDRVSFLIHCMRSNVCHCNRIQYREQNTCMKYAKTRKFHAAEGLKLRLNVHLHDHGAFAYDDTKLCNRALFHTPVPGNYTIGSVLCSHVKAVFIIRSRISPSFSTVKY